MEISKRKELAAYLRWGDLTLIAKLANVSRENSRELDRRQGKEKHSRAPYVITVANKRKAQIEQLVNAEICN